jgi:hypothetical protein
VHLLYEVNIVYFVIPYWSPNHQWATTGAALLRNLVLGANYFFKLSLLNFIFFSFGLIYTLL